MNLEQEVKTLLIPLNPTHLEWVDESAAHKEHNVSGGHYRLIIVSDAFEGKSRLDRGRMVQNPLKKLYQTHIHALSVQAYTPAEIATPSL